MTSATGTSSSGARVDVPRTTAKASASVAAPSTIGEGSEASHVASEGRDAVVGPRADAMDTEDTKQV
jgi:hypothetical protein